MASRVSAYDATVSLSRLTTVLTTPSLKPTLNLPSWFPPAAKRTRPGLPVVRMQGAEPTPRGMLQPGHGVSPAVEIASAQPALPKGRVLQGFEQGERGASSSLLLSEAAKAGRAPALCHAKSRARQGAAAAGEAESWKSRIISRTLRKRTGVTLHVACGTCGTTHNFSPAGEAGGAVR